MLHETIGSFRDMVDPQAATVDRTIFTDEDIYQLELERIFARAWNFMCHESQVAKPGDFFLNFIGEESVIATRDKKGNLQVLLNTCRHRGNAVCRAEQGRATSFLCTYHGWTYDLEGRLVGVPGYKDFYHEALDREQWGLPKAAKVASYKGFVFATMDPEAPDLEEFLGPVGRLGIDLIAERGEMVAVEGVQKNIIGCNWKLAVDNLFDWYHPQISHASAFMSGVLRPPEDATREELALMEKAQVGGLSPMEQRVVMGAYGHAIGGPRMTQEVREARAQIYDKVDPVFDDSYREDPRVQDVLGDLGVTTAGHPNIFPNLWVALGAYQLSLRLPRGPHKTEIWWFTFTPADASLERKKAVVDMGNHIFGAAGLLEQDDGENWDQSTRAMKGVVARRYPLNFAMGKGATPVQVSDRGLAYIDTATNEHAQLWTYRAWADWMDAGSWSALRQNHTPAPLAGALV